MTNNLLLDPGDCFAHGDGQVSRTEIEVACKDCMVGAVAVLGDDWAGNETNEHGKEGGKETHGMVF